MLHVMLQANVCFCVYLQVFAWGYNNCGQIGSGDAANQTTPRTVRNLSEHSVKIPMVINYCGAVLSEH